MISKARNGLFSLTCEVRTKVYLCLSCLERTLQNSLQTSTYVEECILYERQTNSLLIYMARIIDFWYKTIM